jgi:hypothetical protein
LDTLPMPFDLYEHLARRPARAEDNWQARHPFPADNGHLSLAAGASRNRHHRGDAAIKKIGRLHTSVGQLQALPKPERDWHQVWAEQHKISFGQRCKQAIAQSGADYFFHCIELESAASAGGSPARGERSGRSSQGCATYLMIGYERPNVHGESTNGGARTNDASFQPISKGSVPY